MNTEILNAINSLINELKIPSLGVEITKNGNGVFSGYYGFYDDKKTQPLNGGALYFMYSLSKVVTVVAGYQLVEKGLLSLEDKVSKYIPAFKDCFYLKDGQKVSVTNEITIKHLFTMTAGFGYINAQDNYFKQVIKNKDLTTFEVVSALAKTPLKFEPGYTYHYGLNHDILACVIEVVSGVDFNTYLTKNIFEPLEMFDTCVVKNGAFDENKMAENYVLNNGNYVKTKKVHVLTYTNNYQSGGAGILSTCKDFSKFASALSLGGIGKNGKRILSENGVKAIYTPALTEFQHKTFTCAQGDGYTYGLGVRTRIEPTLYTPIGEFGWDGAGGCYTFIDANNKLSLTVTTSVLNWHPTYCKLYETLRELTYKLYN